MAEFECQVCGKVFETAAQVNGHYGGKHVNKHELPPINHGTTGGYMQHRRRDSQPCVECTVAWSRYYAEYRNRKAVNRD